LRQLDTFRGESRFTTWAYRIVINLLADEIRRRAWRRHPLETEAARQAQGATQGSDVAVERHDVLQVVRWAIDHDLTPRQRLDS
jgi:RNA polymerase sigma-70 factor, ECF subfamily